MVYSWNEYLISVLSVKEVLEVTCNCISLYLVLYWIARNRVPNRYLIVQFTAIKYSGPGFVRNWESIETIKTISGRIIIVV